MVRSVSAVVAVAVLLGGCSTKGPSGTTGDMSPDAAREALAKAVPADGSLVTGSSTVVSWTTPVPTPGTVRFRARDVAEWKEIRAGEAAAAQALTVGPLAPGTTYEYEIVVQLPRSGEDVRSGVRTFEAARGLAFTQRSYAFTVKRDYQQRRSVTVRNDDSRPHQLRLTAVNPHDDMAVGFVGSGAQEMSLEMAPQSESSVDLVIHTPDAVGPRHAFVVELAYDDAGRAVTDRTTVEVAVDQVRFEVEVTRLGSDPVTLATALCVKNLGDALTDFDLCAGGPLAGRVRFSPQVRHARLAQGELLKVTVEPILEIGMRALAGDLIASAAGKQKGVPVAFTVPDGKLVYMGMAHSTTKSTGKTWFCTNKPKVDSTLETGGNGAAPPAADQGKNEGMNIDIGKYTDKSTDIDRDTGKTANKDENKGKDESKGKNEGKGKAAAPWDLNTSLTDGTVTATDAAGITRTLKIGDPVSPGDRIHVVDGLLVLESPDGKSNWEFKGGSEFTVGSEFYDEQEPSTWANALRKLEKLFVNDDPRAPSTVNGVRGDRVRSSVLSLRPDVEHESIVEAMALVGPGRAAVAWHSGMTGDMEIYFALVEGETPKGHVRLTRSAGLSQWPWLAADLADAYFVVWEDSRQGGASEAYFKRSLDAGRTWSDDVRLTDHGKGITDPVIVCDSSALLAAWQDGRGGITFRRSDDRGSTWGADVRIADGPLGWPQLAAKGSNVWAVWERMEQDERSQVFAASSTDGGRTWSEPSKLAESHDAGEPSVVITADGTVHAVWRDSRHGQSEIYVRARAGGAWRDEVRVTRDAIYSEYPCIIETKGGLVAAFSAPAGGINCRWNATSADGGATWSAPVRVPSFEPDVERCFFVTEFSLPWDRGAYRKHDVHVRINGVPVADLKETIPEGRYLFEFNPRVLTYRAGGLAPNRVEFETVHLNGGHYVVNSDFSIIQFVSRTERSVIASSQLEADALAAGIQGDGYNHDRPDVAVFANCVRGIPEDRTKPGRIELQVDVVNIGAAAARDVEVRLVKGTDGSGRSLAEPARIARIDAGGRTGVTLAFDYDGSAFAAAVVASSPDVDYDAANDAHVFGMGVSLDGFLVVKADGAFPCVASVQSTGQEVKTFTSGDEAQLPVGVYRIVTHAGKDVVHENVAIRGGMQTVVELAPTGELLAQSLDSYPLRVIASGQRAVVATGRCNDALRLVEGIYDLEADAGPAGKLAATGVLVKTGARAQVGLGTLGRLTVQAPEKWPCVLTDSVGGSTVAETQCNNATTIRAGVYDVEVRPGRAPPIAKRMVRVPAGEPFAIDLAGFDGIMAWPRPGGETATGSIAVEAKGDIPFKVYAMTMAADGTLAEKEMAQGTCGIHTASLAPGVYAVWVFPGSDVSLGTATVATGATTTLTVSGFGTLWVSAVQDFMSYRVRNAAGVLVASGATNITKAVLAAGTYTVGVKPEGYPEVSLGQVEIKDGAGAGARFSGYGTLWVSAVEDFLGFSVRDAAGAEVASGSTNITKLLLPIGTYTVAVKVRGYPGVVLGPVEVKDGAAAGVSLSGFGRLYVTASRDFLRYTVVDSQGKVHGEGDTNITTHLLPVGEYSLRFGNTTVTGVKIEEGRTLRFESGQ